MEGRRIAVFGAAGGIGRALVDRLVAEGACVAALDLPQSLAMHPTADGVAASIKLDVHDPASIVAAAAELAATMPALDGCVNCIGYAAPMGKVADTAEAVLADVLDGNLVGILRCAHAVLPLLQLGRAASLVHISSGLSQFIRPGYGAYAMAKAGINALTKTLALECAPGVRVNAVAPGAVDTAFLTGGTGRGSNGPSHLDMAPYVRALPLQRIAVPYDVVGPIMFLLGPDSAYMTGQILWVNGGGYMP